MINGIHIDIQDVHAKDSRSHFSREIVINPYTETIKVRDHKLETNDFGVRPRVCAFFNVHKADGCTPKPLSQVCELLPSRDVCEFICTL